MKKTQLLVMALVSSFATLAQAAEYVCMTGFVPPSPGSTMGSSGYVFTLNTPSPYCGGPILSGVTRYFCSEGATSTSCPTSGLYNGTQLLALAESLREAGRSSVTQVTTFTGTCNGGAATCATRVQFTFQL